MTWETMRFHDVVIQGPFGKVRFAGCSDKEVAEWIVYGLERGATSFETIPSHDTLGA